MQDFRTCAVTPEDSKISRLLNNADELSVVRRVDAICQFHGEMKWGP